MQSHLKIPGSLEDHLSNLLEQRKQKNRRYSLRKLALDLKLEASFLSKIISGKRTVTISLIERLSKRLNLTQQEIQIFKMNVLQRLEKVSKKELKNRALVFHSVSLDNARSLVGWYHFAILELFAIPGLNLTARKISDLLETPEDQIIAALNRLESLGLLVRGSDRKLKARDPNNTLKENPYTVEELKETQRQFLVKSMKALELLPLDERDHTGMTLAIRKDQIPKAKKLIKNFRRRFLMEMEKTQPYDCVYQLSVGFFPLSRSFAKKNEDL